jgi:hypothetical protein
MLESTEYAKIKLLSLVKSMHNIPRLGHAKDIALFFSNDTALRKDYVLGLIMAFTIIMSIAGVWYVSLLILRILGHRVGCAAGRPATIPAEPMMDNGKESVNTDETGEFIVMQADQNRVNRTRIVFFLSVLYAFAASGVLLWSLFSIQGDLQQLYENAEELTNGFLKMPQSLDAAIQASSDIEASKDSLATTLSQFCLNPSGASVGGLDPYVLTDEVYFALEAIPLLSDDAAWTEYNSTLSEMNDVLVDALSAMKIFQSPKEWWFIGLTITVGLIAICTLYLLACAWKAGKDGYEFTGDTDSTLANKILHMLVLPLYALLIAGAWFVTASSFSTVAANSDLCYGEITTGDTVLSILRQLDFDETSAFYIRTDDYLHGCVGGVSASMPSGDSYNDLVSEAQDNLDVFSALPEDELQAACGGDPATSTTMAEVESFSTEMGDLVTTFNGVYDHMSCATIAPLVQKSLYEVGCSNSVNSLVWTWVSGLMVAVFGTILISLRSATQRPQIYLVSASNVDAQDDDSYIVGSDEEEY